MSRHDLGRGRNLGRRRGRTGRRALAVGGAAALALALVTGEAFAAGSAAASGVHAGVIVLIPRAASVSVFEEITLSRFDRNPSVAIAAGYRDLAISAGHLVGRTGNRLTFAGAPDEVVFHYRLPRPVGRLQLIWPGAVDRLEVFVASGWYLPTRTNPAWQYLGSGVLVKNSGEAFNGYQTESVHAGEATALAVAKGSPVMASLPAKPTGTNRAGAAVLFLLAALASVSWAVLYRRVQKVQALFAAETAKANPHELS